MADYQNCEGYADPTAYAALSRVEAEERQRSRAEMKRFLAQAARLDGRIAGKLEQLEALRTMTEKVTGSFQVFSGGGNAGHGRTEEIVLKLTELERSLEEDVELLLTRKRQIRELIAGLPKEEHQQLLELRYLCFRPWEEIAEEMAYSLHYLYRLHNAALDACIRRHLTGS